MYAIRKGVEKDLEKVLALVQELADFEKEPDAVTASLEDYRKSWKAGDFEFIVAEADQELIGMVLYYMTFSTWKGKMLYLEDFVVTDKWRNKGVGDALFEAFIKESKKKKAVLTKWQVLDWNSKAIEFYQKRGAEIEDNWYNCKLFNL